MSRFFSKKENSSNRLGIIIVLPKKEVHPIKREKVKKGMKFIENLNTDGLIEKIIAVVDETRIPLL